MQGNEEVKIMRRRRQGKWTNMEKRIGDLLQSCECPF
jgi:hypothetical protein